MKILILGAGGIGGYFGAQLLRSGADVTFLLRDKRQALIASEGLRIETPHGNFTVQPPTVTAASVTPIYDLIILAPKSYDLDDALASLENARGKAVVLPFLNGIEHLAALDRKFGRAAVMGGVAHIAATITDSGAVRQLNDIHSLTVGPRDPAHVELAKEFIALCGKAPFDSVYAENIEQALWDKWVFLAALAGMTTLCRGSVGEILATPYGEGLIRQMYDECCAVARLSGYPTGEAATARALGMLIAPGSPFTASMLRDLLAGQRTEYQHILGAMAERGIALGLPMDLMRLAHTHLAVQAGRG
ncbi:ketopantoate reductase family protein [Dechloromonas denitrificans]|uniref:ketopantoate reductase family protein n=1 Tax=Dechloromonas denitrificans TaxID=281362 RepID=UPI001CF83391|nr:ketopantoate reductase family protein [Dechloromonas denitrificans]UCV05562.1 ketopantoate reductase family protein [Dechloromonas denitrificans]